MNIELDPFTKKRIIDQTKKNHFNDSKVFIEMAEEFGRRVAYAQKKGIPLPIAFESCKEHFKIVGQAMIDIANMVTIEVLSENELKK